MRWLLISALACVGCEPDDVAPRPYHPDGGPTDGRATDEDRIPADRQPGDVPASDALPAFWDCNPLNYNTRDGCDCGCGIDDPDCAGLGCATPACTDPDCGYCHTTGGLEFDCGGTPPPVGWSCVGTFYGDGECDCGCTAADADCGGNGCATPDCRATACEYCWGPASGGDCSG
jgi:hypothetical protein